MCAITDADGFGIIASKVKFIKVVSIGAEEPVFMLQNGSKCSEHNKIPGYTAKCGKGTHDVNTDDKIYILRIAQVKEDDATDWSCKIDYPHIAKSRSKRFRIAAVNLTMSAKSKETVMNMSFTLTCKLELPTPGVVRGTIQILRDTQIFAKLLQEGPNCRVITGNSKEYNYKCGNGTKQYQSRVKIYIMEFVRLAPRDKADWLCRIENGDKSNIFSMSEFSKYCYHAF
ncbi:uncharacterized protein LOC121366955 [Gigantopelta aegis]|uniref:uncharacterized protein LOC121366955 n=1 Tax=Gigantopelta aegis TaxID=1735272 RepID=UPI001B889E70|nr:uncharacterized protein LOC121366955 [Gigantopelta aegis]